MRLGIVLGVTLMLGLACTGEVTDEEPVTSPAPSPEPPARGGGGGGGGKGRGGDKCCCELLPTDVSSPEYRRLPKDVCARGGPPDEIHDGASCVDDAKCR